VSPISKVVQSVTQLKILIFICTGEVNTYLTSCCGLFKCKPCKFLAPLFLEFSPSCCIKLAPWWGYSFGSDTRLLSDVSFTVPHVTSLSSEGCLSSFSYSTVNEFIIHNWFVLSCHTAVAVCFIYTLQHTDYFKHMHTQPSVQQVPGALSPQVRHPGCEADLLSLSRGEV
jgi:hypothetical protein